MIKIFSFRLNYNIFKYSGKKSFISLLIFIFPTPTLISEQSRQTCNAKKCICELVRDRLKNVFLINTIFVSPNFEIRHLRGDIHRL